uniref:Uncharacterized protein n=1 Tax=Ditylenchus dipsaci TaxID=166011 RepID=A0A915DHQ3_9BILA
MAPDIPADGWCSIPAAVIPPQIEAGINRANVQSVESSSVGVESTISLSSKCHFRSTISSFSPNVHFVLSLISSLLLLLLLRMIRMRELQSLTPAVAKKNVDQSPAFGQRTGISRRISTVASLCCNLPWCTNKNANQDLSTVLTIINGVIFSAQMLCY